MHSLKHRLNRKPHGARRGIKSAVIALIASVVVASCTQEYYDTGDNTYSYVRADFADAYTNGNKQLVSATTDEGDSLVFSAPLTCSWAEQSDTFYRCLLYHDHDTRPTIARSAAYVLVPPVYDRQQISAEIKTDPVEFESAWESTNGRYLNLGLSIKLGQNDGETGSQRIGLVCDSIVSDTLGNSTTYLLLYHDQNNVPRYYSTKTYVSVRTTDLPIAPKPGNSVCFTVNTDDGLVSRTITFD